MVVERRLVLAALHVLPLGVVCIASPLLAHKSTHHFPTGNPRLCYVAGMDYEVLCGEWGGNRASRLGGGNRVANDTHTGLKTGGCAGRGGREGSGAGR